MINYYGIML